MTDPRVLKLVRLGVASAVATALVAADYDTPAKIKAGVDEDMEDVITSQELSAVRVIFPSPLA